jgi:hypothetical protein
MRVFALISLCLIMLTGCQEKKNYGYWMQHPAQIQRELERCHATEAPQCAEVRRAASDFTALLREQQMDPEKFGQKVLTAEYQLAQLKHEWQQAKAVYRVERNSDTLQKMESAQKAYWGKKEEVRILLAVIGVTSPE